LKERRIDVDLYSGAEVHISHNIVQEIKESRDFLVLNKSPYLLVEFPTDHIFSGIEEVFFEMMSEGIIPVIAHPERNSIFVTSPSRLYELIRLGACSQVNSGSFVGLYGNSAANAALLFRQLKLVHFIASDSHGLRSLKTFYSSAIESLAGNLGRSIIKALVYDNPAAIVNGEEIPYVPDPIDPKKNEKSLKIKLPRLLRKKT